VATVVPRAAAHGSPPRRPRVVKAKLVHALPPGRKQKRQVAIGL
jgi:hypothetical protein